MVLSKTAAESKSHAVNNGSNKPEYPPTALHLVIAVNEQEIQSYCEREIPGDLHVLVSKTHSVADTQALLARKPVDILLLDLDLSDGTGHIILEDLRARHAERTTMVVVIKSVATVDSVIEALRLGAVDYITEPFTAKKVATAFERIAYRRSFELQSRTVRGPLHTGTSMGMLIGRSPAMEKLYRILSKVSFTTHPVLIFGEAGTGKELIARSIHGNGPHASTPFIPIDCDALTPLQVERELFGYVKDAFPEATKSTIGLLASAKGGTVFLDEIAELPLDLQARLLRALQERQVRPIGATELTPISVRVLAATNRDLAAMVESGRFRKDLYYRLNVVNIRIPPLRDRKTDVLLLVENKLEQIRSESDIPFTLAQDAVRLLTEYDWPGNVRELENALEHACALSSGPVLRAADFPGSIQSSYPKERLLANDAVAAGLQVEMQQVTSIAELEKQAILHAIEQLHGDKLQAARLLGIGKTTLYRKLKEYDLETEDESSNGQSDPKSDRGDR